MEPFKAVTDYIEQHLDEALPLETLAKIGCLSKYHFHRQFRANFGMAVFQYVQLRKLKRSAMQLSFRQPLKVIDIALMAGFSSPEAFSRAFKKVFGQTPLDFRKAPDWARWRTTYPLTTLQEPNAMQHNQQVNIVTIEPIQVAAYEHQGPPHLVMASVRHFIEWRKLNALSPKRSNTYNIFYHDPNEVPAADYRMDICAQINAPVATNDHSVVNKIIAGGRYAVLRHVGADEGLAHSIDWLYRQWLQSSDEQLRDTPLFIHRVKLFPDVPEHEMICDIYLPLIESA